MYHCLYKHSQGRRKQSADGQAQLDVGGEGATNLHSKNLDLFLTVRRHSHFTSASNWELPLLCSLSLACTNVCVHTYGTSVPCRILLQPFSLGMRPHKVAHVISYVSTWTENGPAMAGPAGPVPAPMLIVLLYSQILSTCFIMWLHRQSIQTVRYLAHWQFLHGRTKY